MLPFDNFQLKIKSTKFKKISYIENNHNILTFDLYKKYLEILPLLNQTVVYNTVINRGIVQVNYFGYC